jgi:hypothetical protein
MPGVQWGAPGVDGASSDGATRRPPPHPSGGVAPRRHGPTIARGPGKRGRTAEAEVVGTWNGSERVLLREVARATTIDARPPPAIAECLEAGSRVTVHFDVDDRVVGWHLPDRKLGRRGDRR